MKHSNTQKETDKEKCGEAIMEIKGKEKRKLKKGRLMSRTLNAANYKIVTIS